VSNPLANYLHDHLEGASHAVVLLEELRARHQGERLGDFASSLLEDLRLDCAELRRLASQAGGNEPLIAELTDALCARVHHLRPREHSPLSLRTMESLDLIALGLHGRWALWQVLGSLARADVRLKGTDFRKFAARAQEQEARVNAFRREMGRLELREAERS
jgi:hypothetical protein